MIFLSRDTEGQRRKSDFSLYFFEQGYCDKSVNKEQGIGTGNEELDGERGTGTGLWNEARETLRPYPNSITGTRHVCTWGDE